MGIDRQLKRFFPLALCALLALAAYFQASGIVQLIGVSVGTGPAEAGVPVAIQPSTSEAKSGQPILARNPFDSVTGPLDGRGLPEELPATDEEESAEPAGTASDGDPRCSFGKVTLISASEDQRWSFAAIDEGGKSALRKPGDDVNGHTIEAMSWDTVWLAKGSERCKLELGAEAAASPAKPATRTPSARSRRTRRARSSRQLAPELAAKINKVSDTEFNIERSMVDEILQNQAELMRSAKIAPVKQGGDVVGIRLGGIRGGSLLDHLGMKNGDQLTSINGFEMSDPQKALEAYGRLRSADNLSVKVNRGGKPVTIDFNIQ